MGVALTSERFTAIVGTLSLAACVHAGGTKPHPSLELTAGDYEFVADANSGGEVGRHGKGTLHLRRFGEVDQSFSRRDGLYGWTDVDFRKLGAPIGDADTPGDSEDPENPGVLVLVPTRDIESSPLPGPPVMLIGALENKKKTRGSLDGGGIGLFARTKQGQCISGEWSEWGVVVGGRGRFTVCSRGPRSAAQPGVEPDGPSARGLTP
jgi:hypothetical protein